uniref:Ground-like domain-containing protein n=1 Tax=Panagrellus redivivus TaxID=6233 RepID=A0A7E4VTW1_PANRE
MQRKLQVVVFVMALTMASGLRDRLRRQTVPPLTNADIVEVRDSRCNNEVLQQVMLKHISNDVKESKFAIMREAEKALGGSFNVICANGDFSYITSTRLFCLTATGTTKCYAFQAEGSL